MSVDLPTPEAPAKQDIIPRHEVRRYSRIRSRALPSFPETKVTNPAFSYTAESSAALSGAISAFVTVITGRIPQCTAMQVSLSMFRSTGSGSAAAKVMNITPTFDIGGRIRRFFRSPIADITFPPSDITVTSSPMTGFRLSCRNAPFALQDTVSPSANLTV